MTTMTPAEREHLAAALHDFDPDTGDSTDERFVPWGSLSEHERAPYLEAADNLHNLPGYTLARTLDTVKAGALTRAHLDRYIRFVWIDPTRPRIRYVLSGELVAVCHRRSGGEWRTEIELIAAGTPPAADSERYVVRSDDIIELGVK